MDKLLTGNIWKQVAPIAKAAKRRLAAVAYVSSNSNIKFTKDDVLICDASDRAIKYGETSAVLLYTLFKRGVELRSRPELHAKVIVFGKHTLIGSCNMSSASEKTLTELALLTDRKQVISQSTAFIHSLRETSDEIDKDFLQRILKIKVRSAHRTGGKRQVQTTSFGNRVWLASVRELPDNSFPKEQPFVEKAEKKAESLVADKDNSISWIRWTGKSKFRSTACPGDLVIQIWKSLSGKRTKVLAPCPIVLKQDINHWTRFYISEPENCQTFAWDQFKKRATIHGLSRLSKDSVRELNPRECLIIEGLWK
jgi:hypothetical protein